MSRKRGRPARDYEAEDAAFQEAMDTLLRENPEMTDEQIASALVLGFDDEPEYYRLKRQLRRERVAISRSNQAA